MNITQTGWDFKAMQKESDQSALIKIVRLIANLLTVEEIGQDIINVKANYYKDMIMKIKLILKKNQEASELNQELITCCLSCLSNAIFYEK